jgi:intracellular sulfur oxidation DsrE/DsrF family protein
LRKHNEKSKDNQRATYPEVEYVPAGIAAEVVERKQEQGWSYIKGGF